MTPAQRAAALRLAEKLAYGRGEEIIHAEAAAALLRELAQEPQVEPAAWAVYVGDERFKAFDTEEDAVKWYRAEYEYGSPYDYVVRPLYASPQPQQTEPSQYTPPQRPPTPTGWSDTDWIAHLAIMPPIGYATRDHLYGTSAAGVLRFCPHDEPRAFAVYASPPQRMQTIELHEVRLLCGWFESMPDGAQDSQEEARFKAGQRYAASHIRAACECSVNGTGDAA